MPICHPPAYLLTRPSTCVRQFVCLLICQFCVTQSICLPAYLPACLSVCLPACCLPASLSVCLSVRLSISPTICKSVSLSVCLSAYLPAYASVLFLVVHKVEMGRSSFCQKPNQVLVSLSFSLSWWLDLKPLTLG
jgi:hypothetical protein